MAEVLVGRVGIPVFLVAVLINYQVGGGGEEEDVQEGAEELLVVLVGVVELEKVWGSRDIGWLCCGGKGCVEAAAEVEVDIEV